MQVFLLQLGCAHPYLEDENAGYAGYESGVR